MQSSDPAATDENALVPVRLRGHHFLCLLTFRGFGYTPDFIANMIKIAEAVSAGQPVVLVHGPDDICNGLTPACRTLCNHDCSTAEAETADQMAVEALTGLIDHIGDGPFILDKDTVAAMRTQYATGSIRQACVRCPWKDFCDRIALENFASTLLFGP